MAQYTAKMKHSPETIQKLVETQSRTFQFGRRAAHMVIAILLMVYGLYADKRMLTPYLALMAGCVLLTGLNVGIRRKARQIIQQMGNNFPQSDYAFSKDAFTFYKGGTPIPYTQLCRLIEDPRYLYLYISTQSAYMVDKSTISGGSPEGLKDFLTKKTGLRWSRPNSLLTFSFRTLLRSRTPKKPREPQGPRLR